MARKFSSSDSAPKIKTITSAAAREYSREFLKPGEMLPYEAASVLSSDIDKGLSRSGYAKARRKFSLNIIKEEYSVSFRQSLKRQIKNIFAPLTFISALIMYFFNFDAIWLMLALTVLIITPINAAIECSSMNSTKGKLKRSSPKTAVIRGGREFFTDGRSLVPGDIILLEQGNIVPADARLIESNGLKVLETFLTGEKNSVEKDATFLGSGEREDGMYPNMVYAYSAVTAGSGKAIVTATGKDTAVRILKAGKLKESTPKLLKFVKSTGFVFSLASLISLFVLIIIALFTGRDIVEVFCLSLVCGFMSFADSVFSLAAGALGSGMKEISSLGASPKNPDSITKSAYADCVMCDKAGAFPPSKIEAKYIYTRKKTFETTKENKEEIEKLLLLFLACSDFKERFEIKSTKIKADSDMYYYGSPVDLSVINICGETGIDFRDIQKKYFKIETQHSPSGEVKRVLTLNEGKNTVILRGSPEDVLTRCRFTKDENGKIERMDAQKLKELLDAADSLRSAQSPVTVYATASGITECDTLKSPQAESDLTFEGFIAFYSTLCLDAASAVYKCVRADIEPVVRADESPVCAFNHAKSNGIISSEEQIITGEEIDKTERGLYIANCRNYKLFCKISDKQWADVLNIRKSNGRKVAVTASGMNDLALISKADVSFVSNANAPETVMQSADMFIGSGGFDVITKILECSKNVCRRVSNAVGFCTVGCITAFLTLFISLVFNLEFPLRIQELLFGGIIANLIFAFAEAFAPAPRKILSESIPPFGLKPKFSRFITPLIFSAFSCGSIFAAYYAGEREFAGTRVLITFVLLLAAYALTGIYGKGFIFGKLNKNRLLLPAFLLSLCMCAILIYTPCSKALGFARPGGFDFLICISCAVVAFVLIQLFLFFVDMKKKRKTNVKSFPEDRYDEGKN